jgi:starch-binding outer membrane protein, SusD/RagB family
MHMKKIYSLIFALALLASCDVLDVKPQNAIQGNDAFKDKAGIERGVLGAYTPFQYLSYYGRTFLIFSDLAADNLESPADATAAEYREVDNNNILPENGSVSGIWGAAYEGINIANNVMVKVPEMADMTDDEKNKALGELHFIRALNHFNLLNYFGAIPIKTSPTVGTAALNVPRAPVSDVYDQIIDDLIFAETNLPVSSVKTRASRYAATALLARVYLYKGDYDLAIEKATEVIDNGGYALLDNYALVFSDASAESIFEIDFVVLSRNRIAEYNFPKPDPLNGRREVAPTTSIVNAYTTGDERYEASLKFLGALPYAVKYDDIATGADNFIVIRLAEMYLIRAEAEAKLEGDVSAIQNDLNEIRDRANVSPSSATAYATLLTQIEQERRVEFAFEGHRWFDLVRTGRATALLTNVTNANKTLFPIPLSEILTNKHPQMTQNPGY